MFALEGKTENMCSYSVLFELILNESVVMFRDCRLDRSVAVFSQAEANEFCE